jgi:hypothetical protein
MPSYMSSHCRWVLLPIALLWLPFAPAMGKEDAPKVRQLGRIAVRALNETSGLVASRQNSDVVWVHNDGASPRIYALTTTGKHVAQLDIAAVCYDIEDIAIGPGPEAGRDYLYLGDTGDNEGRRKAVRVYRVPEPDLSKERGGRLRSAEVDEFLLTYPGDVQDSEALLVDPASGDIYIVTKEENKGQVYMAAAGDLKSGETLVLKRVLNLKVKKVTGGDISPDGTAIILRSNNDGWLWHRKSGETIIETLALNKPRDVPVRTPSQDRNGESVGFTPTAKVTIRSARGGRRCWRGSKLPKRKVPKNRNSASPIGVGS